MRLPSDTKKIYEKRRNDFESRSLWFEKYADPEAEKEDRANFFRNGFGKKHLPWKNESWRRFLFDELKLRPENILFARQQARLILNASGGVMENAGVCLDRLSGLPYIPGSAVKGCARRMAIESLLCEENASRKAALLFDAALVFGWGHLDWSAPASDFKYACESSWPLIRDETQRMLWNHFRQAMRLPEDFDPKIWRKRLRNAAGLVSFLPAYPFHGPNPDMELDILTCHHQDYYKDDKEFENAPDTEDPTPVAFPTIAPGHVFAFALLPLRGCDPDLPDKARQWLKDGLEQFGLGGKTAAGYGWFECGDSLQSEIGDDLRRKAAAEEAERRKREMEARARLEEEKRREQKKRFAAMSDDERVAAESKDQFKQRMIYFLKQPDSMKLALVRVLSEARRNFWADIQQKAASRSKKDRARWNPVMHEIHKVAKSAQPRIKMP